jgi:N-acetylglucosamine-6-sulfatase
MNHLLRSRALSLAPAIVAAPALLPAPLPAAGAAAPRPNIVHIMVDDMSADALGFRGKYPFIQTPNIDRLAREGLVFDNHFVTTSLCSPSRACILTGRYAHCTGVPDNSGNDPDPSLPTYPALLQAAGYVTAHIGKWHMREDDAPRPGFTHWVGFEGQGRYFDPLLNTNGVQKIHKGYITDILTDETLAFMEKYAGRPFAVNLWHKAMHGPFQPPPRHAVPGHAEYPKPATWDDDLSGKNAGMRRARLYGVHHEKWLASEGEPIPPGVPPPAFDADATDLYRRHLSTLRAVDESVGRILDLLEKKGILDQTVVIFTADNGYFLGEFAWRDKRLAYDPSMRAPLVLRYPPAGRGKHITALTTQLDFAETFLDWAGIPAPATMQGKSWRPLLEGKTGSVRDHVFYEYFQEAYAPGHPTILAIRTGRWKYITFPYEKKSAYTDELYDLREDPLETKNLARDSACKKTLSALKHTLKTDLRETGYKPTAYRYSPSEKQ